MPRIQSQHSKPKWVRYAIVAAALVSIAVLALLLSGEHGPWQHQTVPHAQMAHG